MNPRQQYTMNNLFWNLFAATGVIEFSSSDALTRLGSLRSREKIWVNDDEDAKSFAADILEISLQCYELWSKIKTYKNT